MTLVWIQIVLASATVSALINFLGLFIIENCKVKKTYIKEQLEKFYGPISYLIEERRCCLDRMNAIKKLSTKEYNKPEAWASDSGIKYKNDLDSCIDKENEYGNEQIKLNESIHEIIKSNFQYADIDDHEIISQFLKSHLRLKMKEGDSLPLIIKVKLNEEPISIISEKFDSKIINRMIDKRKRLQSFW